MRHLFIALCTIFFTLTIHAQNPINREVGDFYELKVFNKISVILKQGEENKVRISGNKMDEVTIKNINGVLKISMGLDNLWDSNNTEITVWSTSLAVIDVNEGSSVTFKSGIEQDGLEVRAQEGATIRGTIDLQNLKVKAITGGIVNLNGKVDTQNISITTGGSFLGKYLEADNTEVKISIGGTAEVKGSEMVRARTNAGGTITIHGKPRNIDSKKFLGGKIIEVNG